MIDVHSHILPGIDDGAGDLDESLAMARGAVADGIHTMVATPHCNLRDLPGFLARRDEALKQFVAALAENSIPLRIIPGAECLLDPALLSLVAANSGILLGGPGGALLVELLSGQPLSMLADLLFQANCMDMRIVLAHPERYAGVVSRPERLRPMIEQGLLLQLTADSMFFWKGWRPWGTARHLLREFPDAILLASDAHDAVHRPPLLREGARKAARRTGLDSMRFVAKLPEELLGRHEGDLR